MIQYTVASTRGPRRSRFPHEVRYLVLFLLFCNDILNLPRFYFQSFYDLFGIPYAGGGHYVCDGLFLFCTIRGAQLRNYPCHNSVIVIPLNRANRPPLFPCVAPYRLSKQNSGLNRLYCWGGCGTYIRASKRKLMRKTKTSTSGKKYLGYYSVKTRRRSKVKWQRNKSPKNQV